MRDDEWLASLKAGDELAVRHSAAGGCYHTICRVERATKKAIYVQYEGRFLRNCRYGNGWNESHRATINPVTDEIRAEIQDDRDRSRALRILEHRTLDDGRFEWRSLTTDQLRRIVAIVSEGRESAKLD